MRTVLLVGNFLSISNGSRGVCEDLALRLSSVGWIVTTTSSQPKRLLRLLDMITTTWRERNEYAIAQLDVFSGSAFYWAEIVAWTLQKSGKPYILTLHGGDLPSFAKRQPRRVRRLLQSATVMTTPSPYLLEQMHSYREDLRLLPNPLNLSAINFKLRRSPQPRLVWLRSFHRI